MQLHEFMHRFHPDYDNRLMVSKMESIHFDIAYFDRALENFADVLCDEYLRKMNDGGVVTQTIRNEDSAMMRIEPIQRPSIEDII